MAFETLQQLLLLNRDLEKADQGVSGLSPDELKQGHLLACQEIREIQV